MNTSNFLTDEEYQTLAELLNKREDCGLTVEEQAFLDELRARERNQLSPEQLETLHRAARQTASAAPGTRSRAKLVKCGLTKSEIDLYHDVWGQLDRKESVAPERMRQYESLLPRVERCLMGGGGDDPPDDDTGPDDSGPSITDVLGVQIVEDDEEETKPFTALPVEEPVQVPVPVKPGDDKKKLKPRPRVPGKRGGVDFP